MQSRIAARRFGRRFKRRDRETPLLLRAKDMRHTRSSATAWSHSTTAPWLERPSHSSSARLRESPILEMTLEEIARVVQGSLSGVGTLSPTGYSIDTRTLEQGDLFFAIVGPSQDGHRFLSDAS